MRIVSKGLTDVGLKRTGNEDSLTCRDELGLYIVADGMGGHAAGEVASNTATRIVTEIVENLQKVKRSPDDTDPVDGPDRYVTILENAAQEANRAICRLGEEDSRFGGMGTTLSGMLIRDGRAAIAHVGDSRIYLLRDGVFRAITNDHSWVNEQMERNIITPEEARTHRWRNVITRALGNKLDLEVDTDSIEVRPGDRFLLCSDGLSGLVEESEMAETLTEMRDDLDVACQNLVQTANAAGGDDNITLIILKVLED